MVGDDMGHGVLGAMCYLPYIAAICLLLMFYMSVGYLIIWPPSLYFP